MCPAALSGSAFKQKNIKVLLDFFQKIAVSNGSALGRPPQRANFPGVLQRPSQRAQFSRKSRKPAVSTLTWVADGRLFLFARWKNGKIRGILYRMI